MTTSGNILADRRYGWAEGALDDGDFVGAADLAGQVVDMAPDFAAGWFLLGKAHEATGRRDAACAAFARALALDERDPLGAGLRLAQLGGGEAGSAMPAMSPAYVQGLFDEYAVRFDRHLVQSLKYRGPGLLHDAVRRACSLKLRPFRFAAAVDLGCGTGLIGEAFRDQSGHLAGVDLSPAMIKKAGKKRLYDELHVGDVVAWAATRPDTSVDLVLAGDLFVYMVDLGPVFDQVARLLRRDGLFAFTIQSHEGTGVALGADARYAQSHSYIRDEAARVGLLCVLLEPTSFREDRGREVPGHLIVMAAQTARPAIPA